MLNRMGVVCAMLLLLAVGRNAYAQNPNRPGLAQENPRQANPAQQGGLPGKKAEASQDRYWSTTWEFNEVDIEKLSDRLKAIGIDLGFDLKGKVTVQFDVGVPLTSLRDGKAYRFDGTVSSPRLVVEQVELQDLRSAVTYRQGTAKLSNVSAKVLDPDRESAGRLQGNGEIELLPQGNAKAALRIENVSVKPFSGLLAKFFPDSASRFPTSGTLSGEIDLTVPVKSIGQVDEFKLSGSVTAEALQLASLPTTKIEIPQFSIESGRLKLSPFTVQGTSPVAESSVFRFEGQLDFPLVSRGEFSFAVAGDDIPVGDLVSVFATSERTPPFELVRGKVDCRLNGSGTIDSRISDATWTIDGAIASPSLQAVGLDLGVLEHEIHFTPDRLQLTPIGSDDELPDRFRIRELKTEYKLTDTLLAIQEMQASLFGGKIAGSCAIPLADEGEFAAELKIHDVAPVFRSPFATRSTEEVSCQVSGALNWRVPIKALASPAAHTGNASLAIQGIRIGQVEIGSLSADVELSEGRLRLGANGELFGGTVEIGTKAEMAKDDSWPAVLQRMQLVELQFQQLDFQRVARLVGRSTSAFSGQASGTLRCDLRSTSVQPVRLPDTSFAIELSKIRHRSHLISRQIKLEGRVDQNVVVVRSLSGDYCEGTLRARGQILPYDGGLRFHPRADFQIALSRVRLNRSVWFLSEDDARGLRGYASARATLAGYPESLRLNGSVEGRELRVNSLPIGTAHSGVMARLDGVNLTWNVHLPSIRSNVGGGQLEGEIFAKSSRVGGIDLQSSWKSQRVDFFRLMSDLGTSTSFAQGEISGSLSLAGKRIRSIDDVAGRFHFRLEDTRGTAVPGLVAASQFLGPISLARQTFDVGEAKGIIGQGVVAIDEFWLGADTALVRADGKVYVRSGRMDLRALIATGDYSDVAANFTKLAQQYAIQSVLPASAILSVSEIFRDRTLVISVMGTTNRPIVRLRPVETFREEAVRFLLREGRRLIIAGIAAGSVEGIGKF